MSILPKKFPVPVARPMAPFFFAGLIVMYGINTFQNALMESDEFKFDSRNPKIITGERKPQGKLET